MLALPQSKPDVHQAFCAGQFSVQLSCLNPFGRIPVDQATEVTLNKDTQTPGGTTGFSEIKTISNFSDMLMKLHNIPCHGYL